MIDNGNIANLAPGTFHPLLAHRLHSIDFARPPSADEMGAYEMGAYEMGAYEMGSAHSINQRGRCDNEDRRISGNGTPRLQ
ncbi:hypothetical protein Pla52n_43230 [Stieleria varia]|uniref:Uncharacterized protein n=1 Tax=Stieleria varia TaxID=2528005 RepID=A0A5C6ALP9_9BACT|nr:hypothetical protein Pla52n_43230 [Stieleria varia]